MKNFFILIVFILSFSAFADEEFSLGFEAGVARLARSNDSVVGSSWSFHTEYMVDEIVGFFGEAGHEYGSKSNTEISHNLFGGGLLLEVLPFIDLRLGLALNAWESKIDGSKNKESNLGPLAGFTAHILTAGWKYGVSVEATRSGDYQSTAMKLFAEVIMF
ncbi:MAG: hypothetical protein K2P81_09655 [Bacteriovoracaceae bacterium]|nr:hypothetical protein [Bacteriovoracaceae bacterium]